MSPLRALRPLRRKLPLTITALLCVVVAAVCYSAYEQLRDALLLTTGARVENASERLAGLLDREAIRLRQGVERVASDPVIVRALARSTAAARREAIDILARERAATPQIVALTVWGRGEARPLAVGEGAVAVPRERAGAAGRGAGPRAWITPLRARDGDVVYEVVDVVRGARGDTLGYVVERRRLELAQAAQLLQGLIGAHAALLLGNSGGGLWTDLSARVDGPAATVRRGAAVETRSRDGEPLIGAAAALSAAPWMVWVHVARDSAIAPATTFLARAAALALLFVTAGAVGTWLVSRRLIAPLAEVSRAAQDFAAGDYGRRAGVERKDELGELAASFNGMAERVEASARALAQANDDLRASEGRYRALVETAHEGVWAMDQVGTTTYVNPRLCEMLGYAPGELLGRRIFDFMPAGAAFEARTLFARRQRGIAEVSDVAFLRRDGSELLALVATSPLADGEGAFAGALAMVTDVTERRRAEVALRESEERYRLATRATKDVIYDWDLRSGTLYWSDVLAAVLGHAPPDAAAGIAWWEAQLHPDERGRLLDDLQATLASSADVWRAEYRMRRGDGSFAHVLEHGYIARDARGTPVRMVGALSDQSRHRELEAQLLQAQKMEAVGQLAGGIAHDFNNILTAITSYTELVLGGLRDGDPARADVEEIRQAALRAAALTRQLLAFSRRQVLQPRPVDLNGIVERMQGMLRRLIGDHVTLATALDAAPGVVVADPSQVEQVLMNLAVNARDAMPDGGALVIRTEAASIDGGGGGEARPMRPGDYVLLAVRDTGVGMDDETRERVFEPFFTTKGPAVGTGLGLSTVYGIVKQSGGYVWCSSAPGRGTEFRVYLPAAPAVVEACAAAAPAAARGGSETVLLVEDDDAVRAVATRILRRSGYSVIEAPTPAEALRAAADPARRIDLLFTDMVMPEMGGKELARRVRALRPSLAVLFASGYTEDAALKQRFLEPGEFFIGKPYSIEALAAKVRQVLDRGAGASAAR